MSIDPVTRFYAIIHSDGLVVHECDLFIDSDGYYHANTSGSAFLSNQSYSLTERDAVEVLRDALSRRALECHKDKIKFKKICESIKQCIAWIDAHVMNEHTGFFGQ